MAAGLVLSSLAADCYSVIALSVKVSLVRLDLKQALVQHGASLEMQLQIALGYIAPTFSIPSGGSSSVRSPSPGI